MLTVRYPGNYYSPRTFGDMVPQLREAVEEGDEDERRDAGTAEADISTLDDIIDSYSRSKS